MLTASSYWDSGSGWGANSGRALGGAAEKHNAVVTAAMPDGTERIIWEGREPVETPPALQ